MKISFSRTEFMRILKKNILLVLLLVFLCAAIGMFAFNSASPRGNEGWSSSAAFAASTATPTLAPASGWWSSIPTLTQKPLEAPTNEH